MIELRIQKHVSIMGQHPVTKCRISDFKGKEDDKEFYINCDEATFLVWLEDSLNEAKEFYNPTEKEDE